MRSVRFFIALQHARHHLPLALLPRKLHMSGVGMAKIVASTAAAPMRALARRASSRLDKSAQQQGAAVESTTTPPSVFGATAAERHKGQASRDSTNAGALTGSTSRHSNVPRHLHDAFAFRRSQRSVLSLIPSSAVDPSRGKGVKPSREELADAFWRCAIGMSFGGVVRSQRELSTLQACIHAELSRCV